MSLDHAGAGRWTRGFWIGALVFAGVLLFRLVALSNFVASPSSQPSGGDIAFYDHWAQRILGGELTDGRAFYALPLYAYWLAALYAILGVNAFAPGLVQSAADAGTALLLYRIAERSMRDWQCSRADDWAAGVGQSIMTQRAKIAGVLCAITWAFYLPAQAFSIVRMPTALGVFVFWFLVWQLVKRSEPPPRRTVLLFGLLIGITAMAVATILFIIPLFVAALFWKWRSPVARGHRIHPGVAVAVLLAGVALGTAPCWVHNSFVAHDRVFLSAHSGINVWLGNNPGANGYPNFGEVRAGQAEMLQDSVALAERATGKPLKRSEVSAFWSAKARTYIAADFGGWLRLLARKIWNFWNAFQYDDLSVVAKLREQGLTLPGLIFGIIAATAVAGTPFVLRSFPASRWILAAVFLHMLSLLPVFVTERYRLAAVPGLVIFSVLGLWCFWEGCVFSRVRVAVGYIALLAAAALLVSRAPANPALWALDPYNAGREALETGDLPMAQRKLELAYSYVPENAEINLALGNLWLERGDPEKAGKFYHDTLAA